MTTYIEETVGFVSEGLHLEGVLAYPEDREPRVAALLLPPHPHLGGTMDNNVVRHIAQSAAGDGMATLRFNYRGVGHSEIRLPGGRSLFDHWSEMERLLRYDEILPDARAAFRALREAAPDAAYVLVGYSLGAILAGMLSQEAGVARVVAIGPPVVRVGLKAFEGLAKPKLFVAGDKDFAFDVAGFERAYTDLPDPKRYSPMPGADHFFRKQEATLYDHLRPFLLGV